jgi:predicted TPR repeat methyltransferase
MAREFLIFPTLPTTAMEPFAETPLETALRLMEEGAAAEAAARLQTLIGEGRGGLLARLTLARALAAAGETEKAVATARETASLHPDIAEAALGLGAALLAAEQLPTAIAEFQRALRLDPENAEARYLLGCAWLEAGEPEPALAAFEALSDMPGLADRIADAEAMKARPRSDAGYVRHLFDQFSADYDNRMLGQLSYQAPVILRELAGLVLPGETGLAVLDLGCGTGLSGAAFRDRAAHLVGIDLSPAMIAKARERGVYDELLVGDIESGLGAETYDLVVAADTLVYLGVLDATFAKVATALKPQGTFLFTVESKDGDGFELGPKRRWRHSENYLRSLAAAHGFTVAGLMACVPRHEAHVAVNGYAVALTKFSPLQRP